jgi:hypothetical protein
MNTAQPPVMPDLCDKKQRLKLPLALMLLKCSGIDMSKVLFKAAGRDENYKGEIRSQDPAAGEPVDEDTEIILEVGYPSAVDYMPYQLFRGLEAGLSGSSMWEERARYLMAPFDGAVLRWSFGAFFEQLTYCGSLVDPDHLRRLLSLFRMEMPSLDDPQRAVFWVGVAPHFSLWSGSPFHMPRVLARFFGVSFSVRENVPRTQTIRRELRTMLGKSLSVLGESLSPGSEITENDSSYELLIHLDDPCRATDWLPGGAKRSELREIIRHSMPEHLHCCVKVKAARRPCVIGGTPGSSYLGIASFVGAGENDRSVDVDNTLSEP